MAGNALNALTKFLHSLYDDDPKPPLHVGEVMVCWTYLNALEEAVALEHVGLNTTVDKELINILNNTIDAANSQAEKLRSFLQQEGVPFPSNSAEKPKSDPQSVPMGVKMTDSEIANAVSLKIAASITLCASGISQSLRGDVGLMFVEFQSEAIRDGEILKATMKKRGWIKTPPFYTPPGTNAE
ncbi:DUF3231 family protein [Alteribacillus iranensis]|uniref:DUF3231 family protein n=1 Tax=Alteribacillus iranensis TaxID=930128 RepID=A0A1I2EBI0_9BACI|nr:DUF3231 family protein [Alteribacillus iranensis]SFE90215.1 Protein of unknown function [Alteribacillus iranensis]